MDTRLREIEQWVAEAKNDLDERGSAAYVNKLYLLDAEIRAVIKEQGAPQADSPRAAALRVRRNSLVPALGAAAMLLAAATVYLRVGGPTRFAEITAQPTILTAQPGEADPSASQAGPSSLTPDERIQMFLAAKGEFKVIFPDDEPGGQAASHETKVVAKGPATGRTAASKTVLMLASATLPQPKPMAAAPKPTAEQPSAGVGIEIVNAAYHAPADTAGSAENTAAGTDVKTASKVEPGSKARLSKVKKGGKSDAAEKSKAIDEDELKDILESSFQH